MIQSYRASEPPADKPKQEEDLQIPPPLGWVKFHMRERIKRLERRLFLSTLIERLEEEVWFWSHELLCCFSQQHQLHTTEKYLQRITRKQTNITSNVSYRKRFNWLILLENGPSVSQRGAHVEFILRSSSSTRLVSQERGDDKRLFKRTWMWKKKKKKHSRGPTAPPQEFLLQGQIFLPCIIHLWLFIYIH